MHKKILLVSLVMLIPGLVFAQSTTSYECSLDGKQRRVVILTEPGVTVPCQVQYHKDTEMPGEVQTLWTASSDAGYCESRAKEFVAKLEEWGWACGADTSAAEPIPEAETESPAEPESAVDDTEALEPAD